LQHLVKNRITAALIISLAVLMTGCSQIPFINEYFGSDDTGQAVDIKNAGEDIIRANSDGSITQVIVDDFDQDYYSAQELKAFVEEELQEFADANPELVEIAETAQLDEGEYIVVDEAAPESETQEISIEEAKPIQVVDVSVKDSTVRLTLLYVNDKVYNAYNGTSIRVMTMAQGQMNMYTENLTNIIEVSTGEKLAMSDLEGENQYHVFYSNEAMDIATKGSIVYYSEGVELKGDMQASIPGGEHSVVIFR